jgi:hypothetical protein
MQALPLEKASDLYPVPEMECSFNLDDATTLSTTPTPMTTRFDDFSFDVSFTDLPSCKAKDGSKKTAR